MATSKRAALRSAKQVKSEYFENKPSTGNEQTKKFLKDSLGKRLVIKPEYEEEEILKGDFPENEIEKKVSFEPPDWKIIYNNIKKMRSKRDAAVDQMGAEKCIDENTPLTVQRFHTLIGLMLSSQTKDNVTFAAVSRLKKHGLTVENILKTSKDDLEKIIYPVGFYKVCQILKDKYNCDIPPTVKELCDLPGVGFKMAYLCMDIAWGKMEGIGVDTHVHRISNRLGWTGRKPTKTPEETRKALEEWLPKDNWREINLLMVGFGQQICLPVYPKCLECLNMDLCPYALNPANRSPKKKSTSKKT